MVQQPQNGKQLLPNNRILSFISKHGINMVFLVMAGILLFHPDARPWLTRRFFALGFYQPTLSVKPANAAPVAFSFITPEGVPSGTQQWKGKWVLLNFWAPWCPPCRAELPALQALYEQLQPNQQVTVFLMDVDGNAARSAPVLQRAGIIIPNLHPAGAIGTQLFSGTLPTTILLNPNGELVWKKEGVANYAHPDFVKSLKDLVHRQP